MTVVVTGFISLPAPRSSSEHYATRVTAYLAGDIRGRFFTWY
jgi:hypothetical protein